MWSFQGIFAMVVPSLELLGIDRNRCSISIRYPSAVETTCRVTSVLGKVPSPAWCPALRWGIATSQGHLQNRVLARQGEPDRQTVPSVYAG
jgi:hypothetical protein